jgi:uncharacterized Rmd1/YagE family protein
MNNYLKRRLSLLSGYYKQAINPVRNAGQNRMSVVRTPQNVIQKDNVLKFKPFYRNSSSEFLKKYQNILPKSVTSSPLIKSISHEASLSTPKKRLGFRKRRSEHHDRLTENGYFNITAFATAEEYDLEKLLIALRTQDLYEPKRFFNSDDSAINEPDVLYAVAKYQVGKEPRDIFFFREGTVIMWNFSDMESSNILAFLKNYEQVSNFQ